MLCHLEMLSTDDRRLLLQLPFTYSPRPRPDSQRSYSPNTDSKEDIESLDNNGEDYGNNPGDPVPKSPHTQPRRLVPSSSLSFDQPHPRSSIGSQGVPVVQRRSSRDIHRLIPFRSKRSSMVGSVTEGSFHPQNTTTGVLVSGFAKSFKQLRRKVSQTSNSNTPIDLGIGELTGANMSTYGDSDAASTNSQGMVGPQNQRLSRAHGPIPRAISTIDMRDISTLLKDIYSSIKHIPLSQPAFARSSINRASSRNSAKSQVAGFLPRASMTLRETPLP